MTEALFLACAFVLICLLEILAAVARWLLRDSRWLVLACVLLVAPVSASTYTVNNTGDGADATPGDDSCATAGAVCTLRAAIEEANAHAGSDTINATGLTGTIELGSALPEITEAVTLTGPATCGGSVVSGGITSTWPLAIDGNGINNSGFRSNVAGLTIEGWEIAPNARYPRWISVRWDDGEVTRHSPFACELRLLSERPDN